MKKRFLIMLLLLGIVITAPATKVRGASPSSSQVNVTSTIFDTDTSGVQLLLRSDDYNGSGQATYTSVNNVESFITTNGGWHLNLYPQKTGTRTVYVTPDNPVGTEPTAPPPGYYWKNVEVTSSCFDSSGNTVPFPNLLNGSSTCGFMVDFNYNGIIYKLLVGRVMNAGDPTPGEASVACNAVNSSNQCVDWTITAGNGTNPVVANLYSENGPRTAPWLFIGQYYSSGRVHVTNP